MRSFKFFLTIAVMAGVFAAISPVQARTDKNAAPAAASEDEGREILGYAWPYDDKDFAKDVGTAPIVMELFTAQGCMYCPVADRFFEDILQRDPHIIGLACHVTYRDVKRGSLGLEDCTLRQQRYVSDIPNNTLYTPQMVLNGRRVSVASKYSEVYDILKKAAAAPPAAILIGSAGPNQYELSLPPVSTVDAEDARLSILQYQKPADRHVTGGLNDNVKNHYVRAVSSITPVKAWTPGKTALTVDITPDANSAGAVVLLQDKDGIIAAADIPFSN